MALGVVKAGPRADAQAREFTRTVYHPPSSPKPSWRGRYDSVRDSDWLDAVKWTDDGLVPAIAQDAETGEVLMFAWMNRESLALTAAEKRAVYWSRSRQRLWRKGEESGHVQRVKRMRLDCDNDVVLLAVEQVGGIACHTGRRSCFFQQYEDGRWQTVEGVLKDPSDIYGAGKSSG